MTTFIVNVYYPGSRTTYAVEIRSEVIEFINTGAVLFMNKNGESYDKLVAAYNRNEWRNVEVLEKDESVR